jgi:capsular exopolysaccharide synthesis family protein
MTMLPGTIQERISLPPSARAVGTEEMRAVSPGDVFRMLRRRAVLAMVLFLFLLALTMGGFFVWWLYFPGYTSQCLIECVSNIPSAGLTLEQERLRQEEHERFVATQALLIKSPTILGEALKVNAVRETQWYRSVTQWKEEHLLELTDDLSAVPVRGTNFLRVSMETLSRSDPAVIVDTVVRLWLDTVKKRSADEFAGDLQTAVGELENLDRRIEERRRELRRLADRLPPGVRQDPTNNLAVQEARQLAEQAASLRLELSQLEQFRALYNNPLGLAATAEDRAMVEQDLHVAELKRTVNLLEQQLEADRLRYGANHHVVRQIEAQLGAMHTQLGKLEGEKLAEIQAANREAANTAYENTQHALFLAEEELLKAEARLQDQDRLLFDYVTIDGDITRDLEYRKQLTEYVTNLERIVRQRSAVRINVAQPATDPLERSSPSLLLIPLAVFLSLAFSVGTVLAVEMLDRSVRTPLDIVRFLDVAMLGVVPHTDDEEVAIERVETAVRDVPKSLVAEAFRRIRTNLQFSAPAMRQRLLLVTSPQPEDGKTSVACNLAIALAQGGRRVLLVDANFRRPSLHRIFDLKHTQGLSNILVGHATLEGAVSTTDVALLDVLGSGPIPPNPAELLGGESCRAFLQEAAARYDQVVLDSAPVLLITDALVLATAVDGVILVVRANESSRGIARRACTLLSDVGAHLFGAVLNAAQVTRGGYFREQLRTYYEYQEEPASALPGGSLLPSRKL